jgi:hypothetical protein
MVGLTRERRRVLIDKLPDAANLALGGLVFGQFLSDRPLSPRLLVGGILAWLMLLGCALLLTNGNEHGQ